MSYAEFSYNNSYQESLKMASFEMLYDPRCKILMFWSEIGGRKVHGPDILQDAEEQVRKVRVNLRVAQSRQKSYANHRRKLNFEVGDFLYLKMSLWEVCAISRYEATSYQGLLDRSRLGRRESK
jgi:hypothetical protein